MNCQRCEGNGEKQCPDCNGKGHDHSGELCHHCEGEGHIFCITCGGTGLVD